MRRGGNILSPRVSVFTTVHSFPFSCSLLRDKECQVEVLDWVMMTIQDRGSTTTRRLLFLHSVVSSLCIDTEQQQDEPATEQYSCLGSRPLVVGCGELHSS